MNGQTDRELCQTLPGPWPGRPPRKLILRPTVGKCFLCAKDRVPRGSDIESPRVPAPHSSCSRPLSFLERTVRACAPGPLHSLFHPRTLFFQLCLCSAPMSPPQRGFPDQRASRMRPGGACQLLQGRQGCCGPLLSSRVCTLEGLRWRCQMNRLAYQFRLYGGHLRPLLKMSKLLPPHREIVAARVQGSCKHAERRCSQRGQDNLGSYPDTTLRRGRWPGEGSKQGHGQKCTGGNGTQHYPGLP